jgi:ABC-2 type transport system ATP-binding protein
VCGIDVQRFPLETKKKIGYLPESNPLYYEMYVREYLDFIAEVHGIASKNRPGAKGNGSTSIYTGKGKKERIEEVIQMVGLTPENKKKIGQLSKGYKQRVGLAAALIHNPEVLILDEPTTGLDPNQIIEIREVIKSLGKNKTVLFSSHILQEVEAICDRVIIINKGRIVADDSLKNLRSREKQIQEVIVTFQENVDRKIFDILNDVMTIDQIQGNHYKIQTAKPDAVRKQLLELSLQHNLNIVSLRSESNSLEDIFRDLTT